MCSRAKIPAETVYVFASCSLIQHRAMFCCCTVLGGNGCSAEKISCWVTTWWGCSDEELISLCTADLPGILITIFHLIVVYERTVIYICISNSLNVGATPVTHAEGLTATTLMWKFGVVNVVISVPFWVARHYPVNFISPMACSGLTSRCQLYDNKTPKSSVVAVVAFWQ